MLRGKPLRIERLVNLGLTRVEKGDVRNYREGDLVVFNQNLLNYRLKKDEILTVSGLDYNRVMLLHPDGKPRWIRPAGSSRYRLDVYETWLGLLLIRKGIGVQTVAGGSAEPRLRGRDFGCVGLSQLHE